MTIRVLCLCVIGLIVVLCYGTWLRIDMVIVEKQPIDKCPAKYISIDYTCIFQHI